MIGKWFFEPDSKFVNETNTTNLRTISGVRLFAGTFVVWAIGHLWCVYHQNWTFAETTFNSWLLALTTAMGLSIAGFGWKRQTDATYQEKKHEGEAKVQYAKAEVERAKASGSPSVVTGAVDNLQVGPNTGERPAMRPSQAQAVIADEPAPGRAEEP